MLGKSRRIRSQSNQSGQAALEMALLLPILVLIFLAVIELGRVLDAWVVATNAAREGARYGAYGRPSGEVVGKVNEYLARGLGGRTDVILPGAGEIAVSGAQGAPMGPVRVVVPVRVRIFTPWVGDLGLPDPITVQGAATMRLQ